MKNQVTYNTKPTLKKFKKEHINKCLQIFDSNCPPFFDPSERVLFQNFLKSIISGIPVYNNIVENYFFVITVKTEVIGCGGFYRCDDNTARLSWGMIRESLHGQGYGKFLFNKRFEKIKNTYPGIPILMDTSQHVLSFYLKLGFSILQETENGYGMGLHKYDLVWGST